MEAYGILIITIAFTGMYLIYLWRRMKHYRELSALRNMLATANTEISAAEARLRGLFGISKGFVESADEVRIIDQLLYLTQELSGAMGVSFVPLDERGQPLEAMRRGEFPFPLPDAWLEYLASPDIRQECSECRKEERLGETCPLLRGPLSNVMGLYCLPLAYSGREIGVLNLYQPDENKLSEETRSFLNSVLGITCMALEGIRLRKQELSKLNELKTIRRKKDLHESTGQLLRDVSAELKTDFAILALKSPAANAASKIDLRSSVFSGDTIPSSSFADVERLITMMDEQDVQSITEGIIEIMPKSEGQFAMLAAPVMLPEHAKLGVLVIGHQHKDFLTKRSKAIIIETAAEAAILIQTAYNISDLEYRTMMDERVRLSREIHDGIAQTLGFLKLQVAQMQSYFERGESERMRQSLKFSYNTLAEAYLDVREAIDGLRIKADGNTDSAENPINGWMRQVVDDFRDNTAAQGLDLLWTPTSIEASLPPEVQAQLMRIVQEALSNIRKHSGANQIQITWIEQDNELILEIQDNGYGFSAEDISRQSRHGLQGMRERAELIGAEFQVISRPGEGTNIIVRIPLLDQHWMEI